jgi:hypothetical protein
VNIAARRALQINSWIRKDHNLIRGPLEAPEHMDLPLTGRTMCPDSLKGTFGINGIPADTVTP